MKTAAIAVAVFLAAIGAAFAWDGTDQESGADVEIGSGNLVRPGSDIEYYNHDSGGNSSATVESINRYGSTVEVEVYDHDSGEYRVLEMED